MGYLAIDLSATQNTPDPVVLQEQAPLLSAAGQAFEASVSDAAGKWRALDGLYETPQSWLVLNAMAAPSRQALTLFSSTAAAAETISAFATAVQELRAARTALQLEINAADNHLASLLGSEEDSAGADFEEALFSYQSEFSKRADALAESYEQARAACLSGLSGITRASSDVPSYYASGTLDLVGNDVERLHRQAILPGASAEDVQRYYDALAGMRPADYAEFARDYPEAAVYPPRIGLAAEHQAAFWQSLTPEQQAAMTEALPAVVGNTEGVPYGIRAAANAAVLALVMKPNWPKTEAQAAAYRSITAALGKNSDSGKRNSKDPDARSLVAFDPADPPLAAVAIGNMDTATNVTVNVSGMGSSTQNMESAVSAADNIYTQQGLLTTNHAVLAWIGYDAPGMFPESTEVLYSDKAQTGGAKLATVIDGLYYTRGSEAPFVSVAAHSYGTTTAAYALGQTTHTVDTVVFYGSAGIDPEAARTAADLNAREVYATQGSKDYVAPGGIAGSELGHPRVSPTAEAFGAKVFSSEEDEYGRPNGGHGQRESGSGYLDFGTSSLAQIAEASTGNGASLDLIPQSRMDDRVQWAKETGDAVYYGPGRVVDGAQAAGDRTIDALQEGHNRAAEAVQDGLGAAADALQDHYLPDIGPFANPLDPVVDGVQQQAGENADELRRRFNEAVDGSQHMFERVIDTQQKAADVYFKHQMRALEFQAEKLVSLFRD